MDPKQALNIIKRLADNAILPQSSKGDHMMISKAIETIEAALTPKGENP